MDGDLIGDEGGERDMPPCMTRSGIGGWGWLEAIGLVAGGSRWLDRPAVLRALVRAHTTKRAYTTRTTNARAPGRDSWRTMWLPSPALDRLCLEAEALEAATGRAITPRELARELVMRWAREREREAGVA